MVNTRQKHVKCFICKRKLFNENRLEADYHQYQPISMNEVLLPDGILPPAGWDRPELSWFDFGRCTWMAIDELSQLIHPPIDNVPGAPPPEDTPDAEPIDPQTPDRTCIPDLTKTRAHRQVVRVENAGGKAYRKATALYNKHRKYSEQCNPWHPFQSAHDFQQAESFSQQMKTWLDQYLRRRLDHFKIKSFQSADALQKLLSEIDFWLGDDSWIEDHSHIFGTLYYRDIFKYIQFLLAHLPFQAHLNFQLGRLADSESRRKYSEMNTSDWWWEKQDQLPAGVTIVPVICASDKTHLTDLSGDHHAWPLYLTIGNIRKNIRWIPLRGFLLGWFHVPQKVRKIRTRHVIPRLEQCYPHWGILTSLVPAWNGIVQMDSRDNVILFLAIILYMDLHSDSIYTAVLRSPAALVSYVSFVIKFFAIHQNMGPAQCGNTWWQKLTSQSWMNQQ